MGTSPYLYENQNYARQGICFPEVNTYHPHAVLSLDLVLLAQYWLAFAWILFCLLFVLHEL